MSTVRYVLRTVIFWAINLECYVLVIVLPPTVSFKQIGRGFGGVVGFVFIRGSGLLQQSGLRRNRGYNQLPEEDQIDRPGLALWFRERISDYGMTGQHDEEST